MTFNIFRRKEYFKRDQQAREEKEQVLRLKDNKRHVHKGLTDYTAADQGAMPAHRGCHVSPTVYSTNS